MTPMFRRDVEKTWLQRVCNILAMDDARGKLYDKNETFLSKGSTILPSLGRCCYMNLAVISELFRAYNKIIYHLEGGWLATPISLGLSWPLHLLPPKLGVAIAIDPFTTECICMIQEAPPKPKLGSIHGATHEVNIRLLYNRWRKLIGGFTKCVCLLAIPFKTNHMAVEILLNLICLKI